MVSCSPAIPYCDFSHMYNFVDYQGKGGELCPNPGSLYDYIHSNPNMRKFDTLLSRTTMMGQLNESQADFTIFVPTDNFLAHIPVEYFEKMDNGLAQQILDSSSIIRRINKSLLISSPVSYYITRNPQMRMYITNISGKTRVNNCATIVKYDIRLNNGLIHIVDAIIAPNLDTFMN